MIEREITPYLWLHPDAASIFCARFTSYLLRRGAWQRTSGWLFGVESNNLKLAHVAFAVRLVVVIALRQAAHDDVHLDILAGGLFIRA